MHVIHISAECYPVAKTGGLGDVVGSLPKYLNQIDIQPWVVIPKYDVSWFDGHSLETVHESDAMLGDKRFHFSIQKETKDSLGYPLYVIDIPGRFNRPGIYIDPYSGYPYWDETERFLSFQIAALQWINSFEVKPDILHCHDHHTALIPFMTSHCFEFSDLKYIPTTLTIHNGEYQGINDFGYAQLLPDFDWSKYGLLDWNGKFNSLATGIKTCWKLTTVSESYLKELQESCKGLEPLLRQESAKSTGILNGIDDDVWNPSVDSHLVKNYSQKTISSGKKANKKELCGYFDLDPELPTIAFIGRLVREKGADLLPDLISQFLNEGNKTNFIILGTGDQALHHIFAQMGDHFTGYFDATLSYNEKLAHEIYAGSDFLIMPSRVEPCGLNQMYSMKYGTIPIVRSVGGLKDTVIDIDDDGYGIRFNEFNLDDAKTALYRALSLFEDKKRFNALRKKIMGLDFSWKRSARQYKSLYENLIQYLHEVLT